MKSIRTSNKFAAIVFPGILLVFLSLSFSMAAFGATADPQANSKTQSVLAYLANLPNLTGNKVVSGQSTGVNWNTDNVFSDIYSQDGKYVGVEAFDYFYANNSTTNNQIITHSNANGLTSIHNHWNNPVTNSSYSSSNPGGTGSAWDLTNVDLVQLITNGTALNTTYKGYLDAVATGLQTLQANNVTVLYRPFHEMNGNWFWWGAKDPTQFKNLWIYTFNYLTTTKGLHNLLWVYAPNSGSSMTTYYPGSQYVDVVGMDIYGSPSVTDTTDYNALLTLGKPFALTEYGPCAASGCSSPVNWSSFITSLKTYMPKTVYWVQWAGTFSMYYNTGTSTVLSDSWVITRDDIVLPSTGAQPSPPTGLKVLSVQ